jgi:hypothetical protein
VTIDYLSSWLLSGMNWKQSSIRLFRSQSQIWHIKTNSKRTATSGSRMDFYSAGSVFLPA